jgi:hypothetical protein
LRIIVAIDSLAWIGGAQTYALTTAEHLQRLGHDVVLYAREGGDFQVSVSEHGVRSRIADQLPPDADVAITNDAAIGYDIAGLRPGWPQVQVIHSDIFDSHLPIAAPQLAAVVALYDRVERRLEAMDLDCPIVRLSQPVDVERFKSTAPLRTSQPVVLALGNYLQGERLSMVEDACRRVGAVLRPVGVHSGGMRARPEVMINEADMVIGKARVIFEALACGRAAYVYDHNGGEGWVTPGNVGALAADNFGGQSHQISVDTDRLAADLDAYEPELGDAGRDHIVAHHSAGAHAAALVEVLRTATDRRTVAEPGSAFELARLVRLFHAADSERFMLRGQLERQAQALREAEEGLRAGRQHVRQLEDRLREVDRHYNDARDRVEELDAMLKQAGRL